MSMVHHRSPPQDDALTVRSDTDEEKDLPECKVKRNYACSSCDFFTQNPRQYLHHLRDAHEERVTIHECSNCLYASKHYQKLVRHTKMVHGTEPPSIITNDEEIDEIDDDNSASVFKCSVCAFTAKTRALLNKHEREEHIKTKFFRCTKCTYATHMKARFTKHVKYHSMPMIKCDMCDFRTPYKWNLDRHCKNHNGRGAFRCSACNFTADIKQSLTVHEMNHHVPPVGQAAGLGVGRRRNKVGASDSTAAEDVVRSLQEQVTPSTINDVVPPAATILNKTEIVPLKKSKFDQQSSFGPDFLNPEDIIHRANGNVYIKNKCKLCNFKTAWPSEMTKHEKKAHNIVRESSPKPQKKSTRPIPNLIPIPSQTSVLKLPRPKPEPIMSQEEVKTIYAKSANSALKDLASLFSSEEYFDNCNIPGLIPAPTSKNKNDFKNKNASFFDKLKEKLMTEAGGGNLTCQNCGHKSSCLTEQAKHQTQCGRESNQIQTIPSTFIRSSRCQYCRQRCKSSADLYNHLQTCVKASEIVTPDESESELKIDESQSDDGESTINNNNNNEEEDNKKPHPMENRVFVWNNIEVPMDLEADDSKYEYIEDKIDDNVSLDFSYRTQSPNSESSFVAPEYSSSTPLIHSPVPDKVPTHGNDITVAQHKRVFKCPHCTFWASTASRFHVHIVGHLNKKPFECSLCKYRSNWRWDITKHIKLKSVRDKDHESAKVLMTDETGRRNYTKYNKYLTEIHVSGNQTLETSGGHGTRPRHLSSPSHGKSDMPKLTKAPQTGDFSSMLRPPPPLKAADGAFKKNSADNKRTLFKCKKCNFRHASRDILLEHVKGHYPQGVVSDTTTPTNTLLPESLRGVSPDKDERHCRLKHNGDIRVVSNKNGQEKLEIEEQTDEPDHLDVSQDGAFKCTSCPFSTDDQSEFEEHLPGHSPASDSIMKCPYCNYFVTKEEDLFEHLSLHGIGDPKEFMTKLYNSPDADGFGKRFKCSVCPYVTNSKNQYTYHKQFHKPKGGPYTCSHCSYNVSKRHLLHQHLKVHGINVTPQKQNGDIIDLDDISDEIEEVTSSGFGGFEGQTFADIPLVWVSKNGKFSKMFKCRFCPHVNLRKVNIQEHEKMHSVREKNPNSARVNDVEHRCTECNYVCNNAGVLSSHSKVHQGLYGTVHCLVDQVKSDEEQIRELSKFLVPQVVETINLDDYENPEGNLTECGEDSDDSSLYFCRECPARFLKENEFVIHTKLHGLRSYYKCDYCTYSARQKPHLLVHNNVHTKQYQDRTQVLLSMYRSNNYQPHIYPSTTRDGEEIWLVSSIKSDLDADIENLSAITSRASKSSFNVPLSGTELYQQKSEAQQKLKEPSPPSPKHSDPQFGTLMHGNPNFTYPTYLKNGKMKEKRYKCHKCPSAFEKREQYKVHLNLHGSKQKYNCEHCDYSVKYYANYVQHLKKHKAQEVKSEDIEIDIDENEEIVEKKLSLGDQQALNILQQRLLVNSASPMKEEEKKQTFNCSNCPYVNYRKDAVDNHQKRHISVSGSKNNYTCEHCDYSVPQLHFLRDHIKLHFMSNRTGLDGYMVCDNFKLVSSNGEIEEVVFEENADKEFLPPLSEEVTEKFNNNDGEKQFVNIDTGEVADKADSDNKMDVS